MFLHRGCVRPTQALMNSESHDQLAKSIYCISEGEISNDMLAKRCVYSVHEYFFSLKYLAVMYPYQE